LNSEFENPFEVFAIFCGSALHVTLHRVADTFVAQSCFRTLLKTVHFILAMILFTGLKQKH